MATTHGAGQNASAIADCVFSWLLEGTWRGNRCHARNARKGQRVRRQVEPACLLLGGSAGRGGSPSAG